MFFIVNIFSETFNTNDLSFEIGTLDRIIFSENKVNYDFTIKNEKSLANEIEVSIPYVEDWKYNYVKKVEILPNSEKKYKVEFIYDPNNEDYSQSSIEYQFQKKNFFIGNQNFKINFKTENDYLTLNSKIIGLEKFTLANYFNIELLNKEVKGDEIVKFTVTFNSRINFDRYDVSVEIGKFKKKFEERNPKQGSKEFSFQIPSNMIAGEKEIIFLIKPYLNEKESINFEKKEQIKILPYSNLIVEEKEKRSFFKYKKIYTLKGMGNTNEKFIFKKRNNPFIFFVFKTNLNREKIGIFSKEVKPDEEIKVYWELNYYFYYIFVIVVLGIVFFKIKKIIENPLSVKVNFRNIKRDVYNVIKDYTVIFFIKNKSNKNLKNVNVYLVIPNYLKYEEEDEIKPNKVFKNKNNFKFLWKLGAMEEKEERVNKVKLNNIQNILVFKNKIKFEFSISFENKKKRKFFKEVKNLPSI